MNLAVLLVQKKSPRWADEAVADYVRRVRRWASLEERILRPEPFRGEVDAVRRAEAARLTRALEPRQALIALDERGERLDSDAFRRMLEAARMEGRHLAFVLGGPYGLDPQVRSAAHRVVRLSDLVLNHQVARLVLHEQIYRALATLHGVPYHH